MEFSFAWNISQPVNFKPNQEHSRGSTEFPNKIPDNSVEGFLNYDQTYKNKLTTIYL